MQFRHVMIIILASLAVGLAVLSLVSIESSGADITVDDIEPADYSSIQDAINNAEDGDRIFVNFGTYKEQIVVNKSISIIGVGTILPVISSPEPGYRELVTITDDSVVLEKLSISEGSIGIIVLSDHVAIRNVVCSENSIGLSIQGVKNCSVTDSAFYYNQEYGISLINTRESSINGSSIAGNHLYGIYLHDTSNITITDNQVRFNQHGFRMRQSENNNFSMNQIFSNNETGGMLISSEGNSIFGNQFSENSIGLRLAGGSHDNSIRENRFFENVEYGISAIGIGEGIVDAEYNWWGHPFGPYHPVVNVFGRGDTVTDNVDFDPWLQSGTGEGYQTKFWYVDADAPDGGNGSLGDPLNSVQDAVDRAGNGHVIHINEGTYMEHVVVDRPVDLVGLGDGRTVIRGTKGDGVISVESDWVNITGITVRNGLYGIHVYASNVSIRENDVSYDGGGIRVEDSGYVTILDNTCFDSTFNGLYMIRCHNSTVYGNNFSGNQPSGIMLISCRDITIKINVCNENGLHGIRAESSAWIELSSNEVNQNEEAGIFLNHGDNNLVRTSMILGNEIGIKLISSDDNQIMSVECNFNQKDGIKLEQSSGNWITSNNCSTNQYGIRLKPFSNNNIIVGNELFTNDQAGIHISDDSNYNFVMENFIKWSDRYGIYVHDANFNTINSNDISNSTETGIVVRRSDSITISDNAVIRNEIGISIWISEDCTIQNNTLSYNYDVGITIQDADGNTIKDNIITRNYETGIRLDAKSNILSGNKILHNEDGIEVYSTIGNRVISNTIYGNRDYGIWVDTGGVITELTAEYNAWGDISGPYHPTKNVHGLGDEVTDLVDFAPWEIDSAHVDLQITRHVDVNAPKNGDGTAEHPFRSIQDAINWARKGDIIQVAAGEYHERLTISRQLTLIGDGPATTIIDSDSNLNVVSIMADGVHFSGFHVMNSSKSPTYAGIRLTSHNNTIENVICSNNRNGIYPVESTSNEFVNVVCEYNTLHGMTFGNYDSGGNTIRDSVFRFNNYNGIHMQEAKYNSILNCKFMNNSYMGLLIKACQGITVTNTSFSSNLFGMNITTSNRVDVESCIFNDNVKEGVNVNDTKLCSLTDNVIAGNDEGIKVRDVMETFIIQGNYIENNTKFGLNASAASATVDARRNWWGNDSGPYHKEKNENGTGNRVSDKVRFDPWLTFAGKEQSPELDDETDDDLILAVLLLGIVVFLIALLATLGLSVFGVRDPGRKSAMRMQKQNESLRAEYKETEGNDFNQFGLTNPLNWGEKEPLHKESGFQPKRPPN